jgi:hypothetical protein
VQIDQLREIKFEDFLTTVVDILEMISGNNGLMSSPAFQARIPLIGISVADVVSFTSHVATIAKQLRETPEVAFQKIAEQIRSILGLPATDQRVAVVYKHKGADTVDLTDDDTNILDEVKLMFAIDFGVTASSNMHIDLAEIISSSAIGMCPFSFDFVHMYRSSSFQLGNLLIITVWSIDVIIIKFTTIRQTLVVDHQK